MIENDTQKLWNFSESDHFTEAQKHNLVINKENSNFQIIGISVLYYTRLNCKETEKKVIYQDLTRELKRM